MTAGSLSRCRTVVPGAGLRQRSVVTDPARQPMKNTQSASSTSARVAAEPPLEPTTPAQSGCVSASAPWPETVVQTGMSSASATAASAPSPPARTTPPPQTITGAFAADK